MSTPQTPGPQPRAALKPLIFLRTLGYAISSCLALYSGLWSHPEVHYNATALLLIPFGITLPFFFAYSSLFINPLRGYDFRREDNHYFWLFTAVGGLASFAGCYWYTWDRPIPLPPFSLIIALTLYASSVVTYGWFLNYNYNEHRHFALRYQLIWPGLLSIAVPFYLGHTLPAFSDARHLYSYIPLLPLGMLTLYFFISERFFGYFSPNQEAGRAPAGMQPFASSERPRRGRLFFLFSAASFGVGFLMAALIPSLGSVIASFSFAVAVAAYAAVFEAWNITSIRVQQEDHFGRSTSRYYYGTLTALVCSVFFASLLFPFTTTGSLTVLFLFVHSLTAVFVWYEYEDVLQDAFLVLAITIYMAIAVKVGSHVAVVVGTLVLAMSCAVGVAWHWAAPKWQRVWISLCWLPMSGGVVLLLCD